ncbi:hypothetical protein DPEC_G00119880 [Dallia pectoralis]|uniref:Uncharacterized protein n=1 Tax=Dallia pectoralis TaxID=75939 RepID=A0ACC2GPY8_DALPE|nr:hypothetical protein DPEC_G00119880 [Dallia pectoralis]
MPVILHVAPPVILQSQLFTGGSPVITRSGSPITSRRLTGVSQVAHQYHPPVSPVELTSATSRSTSYYQLFQSSPRCHRSSHRSSPSTGHHQLTAFAVVPVVTGRHRSPQSSFAVTDHPPVIHRLFTGVYHPAPVISPIIHRRPTEPTQLFTSHTSGFTVSPVILFTGHSQLSPVSPVITGAVISRQFSGIHQSSPVSPDGSFTITGHPPVAPPPIITGYSPVSPVFTGHSPISTSVRSSTGVTVSPVSAAVVTVSPVVTGIRRRRKSFANLHQCHRGVTGVSPASPVSPVVATHSPVSTDSPVLTSRPVDLRIDRLSPVGSPVPVSPVGSPVILVSRSPPVCQSAVIHQLFTGVSPVSPVVAIVHYSPVSGVSQ